MKTSQILGRILILCVRLTALAPAAIDGTDIIELQLDSRLTWNETTQDRGPRCFTVQVPEPGFLGVELTTTAPSTAPELLVLTPEGAGEDEGTDTVQRTESILLRVSQAGKHLICLTSQASLGRVEITVGFVGEEVTSKDAYEDETELEPDP